MRFGEDIAEEGFGEFAGRNAGDLAVFLHDLSRDEAVKGEVQILIAARGAQLDGSVGVDQCNIVSRIRLGGMPVVQDQASADQKDQGVLHVEAAQKGILLALVLNAEAVDDDLVGKGFHKIVSYFSLHGAPGPNQCLIPLNSRWISLMLPMASLQVYCTG